MSRGSLAVVEEWLAAVNRSDGQRVIELPADDVEIIGPRGTARSRCVLTD